MRRNYPIKALAVTERHGQAFINGDVRSEQETRAGSKTTEDDKFFEEGIDYFLKGYAYHPNLVAWDAQFRLGLSQQRMDINGDSFDTNGNLLGYTLSALLLQQKPISVRLAASDNDEFLQRSFARTNEYKTSRQAIQILSRYLVSSSLLWENLRSDEISDMRETKRHTRRLRFSAESRTDPGRFTSLVYEHEDTAQTATFIPSSGPPIIQDQPTKRDEVNFSNLWHFGPEDSQNTLSGRARYLKRTGFFPDEVITLDQRLDLVHTPTFSTFYHGLYDRETTETEKDELMLGEAGFLKKIYGSLDLGGRVTITSRDFGTGTEDITGVFVNADYRKRTDIGPYQASLLLGRQREKQTSTSGVKPVIDESVTLSGITFVALAEPNVLIGTIVVTTADHSFTYREGIDYEVHTIGVVTEIARMGGGLIGDPETVLVSYSVTAALKDTFNRTLIAWTNRLGLRWVPVWLYFEYHLRDEELVSGDDPGNLDRIATTLLGVEYRYHGLSASAEHEIRDERLSPSSNTDRLRVRYQQRLNDALEMALGGHLERVRYSQGAKFGLAPGRDKLDVFDLFARVTTRIRRDVLLLVEADYYDSSGQTNSKLTRLGIGLRGSFRSLDFSVKARHSIFQQEMTDGSRDTLSFSVSRRF